MTHATLSPAHRLHVLLVPAGTPGDTQPFVDLGHGLLARGHRVTLVAHDYFRARAEREGFDFASIGSVAEYETLLADKNLWDVWKSYRVFAKKLVGPSTRPIYRAIEERYEPGKTVVAAQSMAFGARVAQDKLGIPTATIHRQPTFLRSLYQTSRAPMMALPDWMPRAVKAAQFRHLDLWTDHPYLPFVNPLRAELELSPVSRWSHRWINSPDAVIGFWADWFAPLQPDWPKHTTLAGFVGNERGEHEASDDLRKFLNNGEPPIV